MQAAQQSDQLLAASLAGQRPVADELAELRAGLSIAGRCRQSNHEGVIIDWIQEARGKATGIIINAAGLAYVSIAVLDALLTFEGPIIEAHMSNIWRREPFRHHSFVSKAATGVIAGLGTLGYELALTAMAELTKPSAG